MAKILLVEDDLTFSQMLQNFVQKNGHEITATSSIKTGLRFLEQNTFDLLLLDYRLPDGTGMDILADIREKGRLVPAIMMTSFNDVRTAVKAIRSGAFDFITKPVNPDELLMIMNAALSDRSPEPLDVSDVPSFIKGKGQQSDKLVEHISLILLT